MDKPYGLRSSLTNRVVRVGGLRTADLRVRSAFAILGAGAMMTCTVDYGEAGTKTVVHVDKTLRGANTAEPDA